MNDSSVVNSCDVSMDSILDSTQEGDSFLDAKVHETLQTDMDGIRVQISPDKTLNLPSLSEAQRKAIVGKWNVINIIYPLQQIRTQCDTIEFLIYIE